MNSGHTLSRSFIVSASLFTFPTLSTNKARMARIRLRAVGEGKDFSNSTTKRCVWNGWKAYGRTCGCEAGSGNLEPPSGGWGVANTGTGKDELSSNGGEPESSASGVGGFGGGVRYE